METRLFARQTVESRKMEPALYSEFIYSNGRAVCRMFTIFATSFSTGNLLLTDCFGFRISPRGSDICPNPEEPEGEDKDVQMERMRTTNAVTVADVEEKPVIIASCLRKEYAGKKRKCFAKRKKKVAIRNVSFCVKKGEVIGFLGHNGAGKSTTIKMITGDTNPTSGQVSKHTEIWSLTPPKTSIN